MIRLTLHRLAAHVVEGGSRWQVRDPDARHIALILEAHPLDPTTGLPQTAATYWLSRSDYPDLHAVPYESPRAALLALVAHHNRLVLKEHA